MICYVYMRFYVFQDTSANIISFFISVVPVKGRAKTSGLIFFRQNNGGSKSFLAQKVAFLGL